MAKRGNLMAAAKAMIAGNRGEDAPFQPEQIGVQLGKNGAKPIMSKAPEPGSYDAARAKNIPGVADKGRNLNLPARAKVASQGGTSGLDDGEYGVNRQAGAGTIQYKEKKK